METFNSDLWLLIGTAGPVLALSHAVALERFLRLNLGSDELAESLRKRMPRQSKKLLPRIVFVVVKFPLWLAAVGTVTSSAAFVLSLFAMRARSGNSTLSIILLIASVAALISSALFGAFSGAFLERYSTLDSE